MRRIPLILPSLLLVVCLLPIKGQATAVGVPVPKPTATGQSITSSPTAPFTWTPVTLPYGVNGTGQMAVGGTVDATTRFSVSPQGAAENGVKITLPASNTGAALQVTTSTGANIAKFSNGGGLTNTGYSLTNALSAPTGLAVTTAGTAGTTTYRYYVVAVSGTGSTTVSNEAVVTTANAALTSTNYNAVSWTAVAGAESYSLYRTPVSGASGTEGLIVAGLTGTTYADYIAAPVGAGYTVAGAGTTAANGNYIPVTGGSATLNGATQYTNGTYFLAFVTDPRPGYSWSIANAVNTTYNASQTLYNVASTAGGTTSVPLTGWTVLGAGAVAPAPTLMSSASVPGATYPTVNTTGYYNAASYQVGGVAGVTTTLADGSAVTKGIVTAPGTTIVGNGSQVAVGGTVDATTRLSVNPQGTAENGLTVNMPSGATGAALQVKTSGTKVFGVAPSGAVAAAGYGVGSAVGQTVTVTLAGGAGTLFFTGGILTATAGLTVVNTAEQGYPEATG